VGKLLGASLLVTGAYQRAGASVRLTARFVDVETGQIVGTAKVDGPEADFLGLQDRVTTELLRSAKLEPQKVVKFARRTRPKLKSIKAVELYGDAVITVDEERKKELLRAALEQDPGFVYASRDLDALEKRLREYQAIRDAETQIELKNMLDQLRKETDPMKAAQTFFLVQGKLTTQRRWVLLDKLSREMLARNPPLTMPGFDVAEMLHANGVTCAFMLQDHDRVLREGDAFLAKYPAGNQFMTVKNLVERSLDFRRKVEEGKTAGPAEFATLRAEEKADPCRVGLHWLKHNQWPESRKAFEECLAKPPPPYKPGFPLEMLIMITTQQGDVPAARKYLGQLEAIDKERWKSAKSYEWQWAADR
jgi:hypothetical protein